MPLSQRTYPVVLKWSAPVNEHSVLTFGIETGLKNPVRNTISNVPGPFSRFNRNSCRSGTQKIAWSWNDHVIVRGGRDHFAEKPADFFGQELQASTQSVSFIKKEKSIKFCRVVDRILSAASPFFACLLVQVLRCPEMPRHVCRPNVSHPISPLSQKDSQVWLLHSRPTYARSINCVVWFSANAIPKPYVEFPLSGSVDVSGYLYGDFSLSLFGRATCNDSKGHIANNKHWWSLWWFAGCHGSLPVVMQMDMFIVFSRDAKAALVNEFWPILPPPSAPRLVIAIGRFRKITKICIYTSSVSVCINNLFSLNYSPRLS